MITDEEFTNHLKRASAIVATWPEWKQRVLGFAMTPEFLLCDKCGAKISKQSRCFVETDRKMDAAGSSETEGFNLDLCAECWPKAYQQILRDPRMQSFDVGRHLKKWITQ